MENLDNSKNQNSTGDELDIRELFQVLLNGKWIIVSVTAVASTIAIIYSLMLPNIYESKAVIVPVDPSDIIAGSLQNYSGIAGLAGINLSSTGSESNSKKAIKKLKSLSFFENNIMPKIFLPDLMALKSWDINTNTLNYDEDKYNLVTNKWVRDFSYPYKQVPSAQESFEVFKNQHLIINEDNKTGFITLTVRHQSPFIAKDWAELLINEVNTFYRQKDKSESQKAVSYLNDQILMTNLSQIKQAIAELIQQETQKLTLIEANQSYVFDYIDTPAVMEKKSEPSRALICIFGAILGGLLGIFTVLIRSYIFRNKDL